MFYSFTSLKCKRFKLKLQGIYRVICLEKIWQKNEPKKTFPSHSGERRWEGEDERSRFGEKEREESLQKKERKKEKKRGKKYETSDLVDFLRVARVFLQLSSSPSLFIGSDPVVVCCSSSPECQTDVIHRRREWPVHSTGRSPPAEASRRDFLRATEIHFGFPLFFGVFYLSSFLLTTPISIPPSTDRRYNAR